MFQENILVVFGERLLVTNLLCVVCHNWVHKRCSRISGRLMNIVDFHCIRCLDGDSVQAVLLIRVFIYISYEDMKGETKDKGSRFLDAKKVQGPRSLHCFIPVHNISTITVAQFIR